MIYVEKGCEKYSLFHELNLKYKDIEKVFIDDHNNISSLRERPDSDFIKMKRILVLGIRKSLTMRPNNKTSDYLVPYTSSGCPALCKYCYLVCSYFKCSYLRVFVNREEMMDKLKRKALKSEKELVFEIGSNSDLVIENEVTGNLEWTIKRFGDVKNAYLTLPTKFHTVDSLLDLPHNGRTIIRMSVNPEDIIRKIEIGTSSLEKRLEAIRKLYYAGYPTGILIAPVILTDNYKEKYEALVKRLSESLDDNMKRDIPFEIILMTYGLAHRQINEQAFPGGDDLYDKEKMAICGRGKYMYRMDIKVEAREFMYEIMGKYLPECKIEYIV